MLVLIVDDDPIALSAAAHAIRRAGYDTCTARNGREAVELLRTQNIRMVVSDWEMPEMTGLELCRVVRREELQGYVYFILLTSRCGPAQIVEGMSVGADDFISKPFDPAELIVRLRAGERVLSLEMQEMVIFALAKLAESRDPETGQHLERVQRYSRLLAQHLSSWASFRHEIDTQFVRLVYLTSPLHDIGKVGIPDNVLLKPGRLTPEEFEIMKTHTTIGAETLDAALRHFPHARFLQIARDIALSHHERYDGKGYPRGLSGDRIPLCGRIVAVADVYDALTSKRVYKEAMSHEQAKEIIVKDSGKHFDPDVVEAFLANEQSFNEIRESFTGEDALQLQTAGV